MTPELPQWAKESVICWYSPKYQRASDAALNKDPQLVDLSGNGNHMALTVFKSPIVANKGLILSNAMGTTVNAIPALSDYTLIFRMSEYTNASSAYPSLFQKSGAFKLWWWGAWTYEVFRKTNVSDGKPWRYVLPELAYITPDSICGYDVSRGTGTDSAGSFVIGGKGFYGGILHSAILFNRTLTEEERTYIMEKII